MNKYIALLYNHRAELDEWVESNKEYFTEASNIKYGSYCCDYSSSGHVYTFIVCRCNPENVRNTFCGRELSMYQVLGDSMYDGEALRFVATRVRKPL